VKAGAVVKALVVPQHALSISPRAGDQDELICSTWTGDVGLLVEGVYSKSFSSNVQIRYVYEVGDDSVVCIPHIEGVSRSRSVEIWTLEGKLVASVDVWSSIHAIGESLLLQTGPRTISKVDVKGRVLATYTLKRSNAVALAPSPGGGDDILVGYSDGRIDPVKTDGSGGAQVDEEGFWPSAIWWTATCSGGGYLVVNGGGCHYFTKTRWCKDSVATTATCGVYLTDDTVVLTDSETALWIASDVNSKPKTRKIPLKLESKHLWLGPRLDESQLIIVALLDEELRVYRLNVNNPESPLEEMESLRTAVEDVITNSVPSLADGALAIPCEKAIVIIYSDDDGTVAVRTLPCMKYDRWMAVESSTKLVYALSEGEILVQSWGKDKLFDSFKLPPGTTEHIFCGAKGQLFANTSDGRLFVREEGAWQEVKLKRQLIARAFLQGQSFIQNLAGPPEFVTID